MAEPAGPEIGRYNLFSDVETADRFRGFSDSADRASCIDQHGCAVGSSDEDGVSLANIDSCHLKNAGGNDGSLRQQDDHSDEWQNRYREPGPSTRLSTGPTTE